MTKVCNPIKLNHCQLGRKREWEILFVKPYKRNFIETGKQQISGVGRAKKYDKINSINRHQHKCHTKIIIELLYHFLFIFLPINLTPFYFTFAFFFRVKNIDTDFSDFLADGNTISRKCDFHSRLNEREFFYSFLIFCVFCLDPKIICTFFSSSLAFLFLYHKYFFYLRHENLLHYLTLFLY